MIYPLTLTNQLIKGVEGRKPADKSAAAEKKKKPDTKSSREQKSADKKKTAAIQKAS